GELVSNALSGKTLNRMKAGDVVPLSDEVSACVVWPEAGFAPREDNDGSLVLHVSYGQTSALLTGDITERVDQYASADADILKVAHHGSKKATSETFLNAVTPEIAVISVSSNGHGHPTEEVLSRIADMDCEVYRTDCMGAITIRMEKDGTYQIKTELPLGG
ncbi:MAG: MBL fold metallo-hydrolase, partial [Clostridia bacterium]|nr:MBL fold metallo-hydrolase [Clostridia bacterium]